ncbi:TPA: hypothetical protein ACXLHF_004013 [Klebsiella pneumoniae]
MGTTLSNGVYLPDEGERNCYAGLKVNWEILNQKVADIVALQLAIAGALHREIVESLPTTDIDPNTIYMILSGTSATENVYNEFMYVNNAWELIGTSATDLTNYYTKGDVDGLLLLKANASDLTSHTGDTTIHVTASDKSKWNTVALIKQLRLVNTQVGSSTTIAFANIDDTNGIKVGDKCMDLDAKMFEITAVDTTNETVTVGSALIDLALDSDVVHKSGNETVSGEKTFANNKLIVGRNTDTGSAIQFVNADVVGDSANGSSGFEVYGSSISDANKIGSITIGEFSNNGGSYATIECNRTVSGVKSSNAIRSLIRPNGLKELSATVDNDCKLGTEFLRWSKIYGTEYYYGSNNVEFSTKFVTTDTNQTISGAKTFSDNVKVRNNDITRGSTTGSGYKSVTYTDSNDDELSRISVNKISNGSTALEFKVSSTDNANTVISSSFQFFIAKGGSKVINPSITEDIALGRSSNKWSDVVTAKVNGVEPSSLSLPSGNSSDFIDISGSFTNTGSGDTNTYAALANGWIYLRLGDISSCQVTVYDANNNRMWGQSSTGSVEQITVPILKGQIFTTQWNTSSSVNVANAKFIPCQGNV